MKKLEDIPKKEIFNVPEGYFENLPGIIQARVTKQDKERQIRPAFSYAVRYALAVVVLCALGIFWFTSQPQVTTAESLLASIQTEDLVAYLNDGDLTTEELLEDAMLSAEDANQIEEAVFGIELNDKNFEDILDEID